MRPRPVPHPAPTGRPAIPPEAVAQAGCFTRSQARVAGIGDHRQRLLITAGTWVPVVGPVVRAADVEVGPWLRAHAAVLASGRYRAVSHSTAAALWGWPVDESLHLIRPGGRLHAGLTEHRLTLGPHETVVRHGIRITTLPRTVTDILAGFDADSAVAALAEGFRRGVFEPAEVIGAARHAAGRTGAVRARHVAWTCRGGPWSFLEWEFHQVAWSIDPDGWRFNVPIRDGHGLIGVVDAMHEPTGTVVELDGRAFHQDRFQQDRSRDQRLAALGLLSVRFTHADMRVPLAVAAQLRTILATRQRGAA